MPLNVIYFYNLFRGNQWQERTLLLKKNSFGKGLGNTIDNNPTLGEKELSSLKKTI